MKWFEYIGIFLVIILVYIVYAPLLVLDYITNREGASGEMMFTDPDSMRG